MNRILELTKYTNEILSALDSKLGSSKAVTLVYLTAGE